MSELHVGLIVLGVPLLLLGLLLFGRYRPVAWMYVVALAIGLGYLTTTGAVTDIGAKALTYVGGTATPAPAAAPAADSTPVETYPPPAEPAPAQ